ncbi:MAG: hypothetical protein ACRC4N_11480 [Gammaproteobacteria bacterium]
MIKLSAESIVGQIVLSRNQEKDSVADNQPFISKAQTELLMEPELVHSVDGRRAQGRNGQTDPTADSSEARVETGTHQETERNAGQEHRETLTI